jgi:hypothetical protein
VAAQASEDERSVRLRRALRENVAESIWQRFFAPSAFRFEPPGLKVYVSTAATRDWLETNFARKLLAAARAVEPDTSWVWFETGAHQPGAKSASDRRAA